MPHPEDLGLRQCISPLCLGGRKKAQSLDIRRACAGTWLVGAPASRKVLRTKRERASCATLVPHLDRSRPAKPWGASAQLHPQAHLGCSWSKGSKSQFLPGVRRRAVESRGSRAQSAIARPQTLCAAVPPVLHHRVAASIWAFLLPIERICGRQKSLCRGTLLGPPP